MYLICKLVKSYFNFKGEKPEYCIKCKKPGMITCFPNET